jgi:catechol 2,3-dioxygenase-like lactoylglutathione lyase family enzyme
MTRKRTGNPWMPAEEYGRSLPRFTVNLLVKDVARSVAFYTGVLGATSQYSDADFAALELAGVRFMLHADHTYDQHPLASRLAGNTPRGTGAELRVLGANPDEVEARARASGATIVQSVADRGHGWRDVLVADPDGYVWAVGVPLVR